MKGPQVHTVQIGSDRLGHVALVHGMAGLVQVKVEGLERVIVCLLLWTGGGSTARHGDVGD